MNNDIELKPCPFCNSCAGEGQLVAENKKDSLDARHGFWHIVRCWNCSAQSPLCESSEEAIEKWNNRPQEAAINKWKNIWKKKATDTSNNTKIVARQKRKIYAQLKSLKVIAKDILDNYITVVCNTQNLTLDEAYEDNIIKKWIEILESDI